MTYSHLPVGAMMASDVVPATHTEWLWPGRIPFGELTLFEGTPGAGKSTILTDVAARVIAGMGMPFAGGARDPAAVVWCSNEEHPSSICGRFLALNRKGDPVYNPHSLVVCDGMFNVADLGCLVLDMKARLVVLDPLKDWLECDDNNEVSVRRALSQVVSVAHATGCAIVGVRHVNKSASSAMYAGGGSKAYTATARAQLLCGQYGGARALAVSKLSGGRPGTTVAYDIDSTLGWGGPGAIAWGKELLGVSADKMLQGEKGNPNDSW